VMALYRDYRGPEYDRLRSELEPDWAVQAYADRGNAYHGTRIRHLAELMAAWGVAPAAVLDYGGEEDAWLARGAFPGAQALGYDISCGSAPPAPGSADLVLCAHVLEHVSFPVAFLRELIPFLAPGGRLYLEVPCEHLDLAATLLEGHPFNRMHEHVAQFSATALARLARACGLAPLRLRAFRNPYYKAFALLAGPGAADGPALEMDPDMAEPLLAPGLRKVHDQALLWARAGTRIAVHPAGAYAMELLAHTALGRAEVVALSDGDPSVQGRRLMGRPVVAPADLPSLRPDLVLIASPRFEQEIATDLAWLEGEGIRVAKASRL